MEKTLIKKCSCGSSQFSVLTSGAYRAEVDENGNLSMGKCFEDSIDSILCEDCGKEYTQENFNEIY